MVSIKYLSPRRRQPTCGVCWTGGFPHQVFTADVNLLNCWAGRRLEVFYITGGSAWMRGNKINIFREKKRHFLLLFHPIVRHLEY
jgi:hypothetical protein